MKLVSTSIFFPLDPMPLKEESREHDEMEEKCHYEKHNGFITEENSISCSQTEKTTAQITETGSEFTCQQCGRSFARKGNLKVHTGVHTGERPYSCVLCRASFTRRGSLKAHMRTHPGESPYICKPCEKSFSSKEGLKAHMRRHAGEKCFKCRQCGTRFSDKNLLKDHVIIAHAGEKPFMCEHCGKTCSNQANLEIHRRIHTGEKPFTSHCKHPSNSFHGVCVRNWKQAEYGGF
uniref:C2H2-type domain-containing protein n=1 Tax=Cyprinus carpio TaxID=7962 RepID=A0A8C1NSE2_CYPCA